MIMASELSINSIGLFNNREALERFPKDCLDLTFDYIHKRYVDLNLKDINESYDDKGCMDGEMRKKVLLEIYKQGKFCNK